MGRQPRFPHCFWFLINKKFPLYSSSKNKVGCRHDLQVSTKAVRLERMLSPEAQRWRKKLHAARYRALLRNSHQIWQSSTTQRVLLFVWHRSGENVWRQIRIS